MLASLSMNTGRPTRSAIRSRIGTSAIGRLTEVIATPRSRSIVARDPEPDRLGVRAGLERPRGAPARASSSSSSSVRPVVRSVPRWRMFCVGVDDPDGHLRAPEVRADRSPHVQDAAEGVFEGHAVLIADA